MDNFSLTKKVCRTKINPACSCDQRRGTPLAETHSRRMKSTSTAKFRNVGIPAALIILPFIFMSRP